MEMLDPVSKERMEGGKRSVRKRTSRLRTPLIVAVLFILIRSTVAQAFFIPSGSMEPILNPGDRVLVSPIVYRFEDPSRGDIVVFDSPLPDADHLIKRIVGLPGERVQIKGCVVFIDGVSLSEPYLEDPADWRLEGCEMDPISVPAEQVFVMGDARDNSTDSRIFGPIPIDDIVGRAYAIAWPPTRVDLLG